MERGYSPKDTMGVNLLICKLIDVQNEFKDIRHSNFQIL